MPFIVLYPHPVGCEQAKFTVLVPTILITLHFKDTKLQMLYLDAILAHMQPGRKCYDVGIAAGAEGEWLF